MQRYTGKLYYILIIVFMVIIILIANLGENFKNDVFSIRGVLNYQNKLSQTWKESPDYQSYIINASENILKILEKFNYNPDNTAISYDDWENTAPSIKFQSQLEILSRYGRTIRKYEYGTDFFDDFRGEISTGVVKSKAAYLTSTENYYSKFNKILLFDGYNFKSNNEISAIDTKLMSQGVSGVISPSLTLDLKTNSGLYEIFDKNKQINKLGLSKLIVSQKVFNELREFSNKNYIIKIKTGGSIQISKFRNVYVTIKGKNTSYSPLIIACFFDPVYKSPDNISIDIKEHNVTLSILLETIKIIQEQKSVQPDRTIIFSFLSGYMQNKNGLDKLLNKCNDADVIVLDNFGKNDRYNMDYNKNLKNLSKTIQYFMTRNNLKINSKNIYNDNLNNFISISSNNQISRYNSNDSIKNSGKFLLSFIGDECYNLDFLSGNIRTLRTVKRYIRNYTIPLSIATFAMLIFVIFKNEKIKNN